MPSKKSAVPRATPLHPEMRALILGASSGMGAALARRLARAGYTIALVARRGPELGAVCDEINASSGRTVAVAYVHDVSRYDEAPELLRQIVADLGGLDVVVYAAGVNYPPGMDGYDFAKDREML
ncbi:MAG TPA: SDR family NAD(P)-dependent oxidoreductase, partial [Anaerolineales bacterium]